MSILPFFRRAQNDKLAVVFDVSSGSVGGALIALAPGADPKIFYTTRVALPMRERLESKRFIEEMLRTLDLVAEDIKRYGFPHVRFTAAGGISPSFVFYFLASPWHVSQVRVLKKSAPAPFLVERDTVSALAAREMELFKKAQEIEYQKRGMKKEELSVIEQSIFDIRLNKYPVDDPFGKSAREFEMVTYMSVAPDYIIRMIEERGARHFATSRTHTHSFMFAFFSIARDMWHAEDTFLLVDVSREVTDIGVVRDGRLLDMVSFPMGYGTLFRDVARDMKTSIEEAQSLVRLAVKKKMSESQLLRMQTVLAASGGGWLRQFNEEIRHARQRMSFSHRMLLTTHNALSYWFKELIEGGAAKGDSFDVALLNSAVLSDFYRFKEHVEEDPFLAIEAIFINKDKDIIA